MSLQVTQAGSTDQCVSCMQASAAGARSVPDKPVPMNLTAQAYLHRMDSLAALQAAWSPVCALPATGDTGILPAFVFSYCSV